VLRWLLIILGSLIAIVVAITVVGILIPRTHVASSSLRLPQPADTVWAMVRNVESYPDWWSYAEAVSTGAEGMTYTLLDRHGQRITYEVVLSDPPRRFEMRIADEDLPFGGSWTYEVEADGAGSRVTITENGVVKNPLFRFMARFVFGYHATIESYLAALADHFGVAAAIERGEP